VVIGCGLRGKNLASKGDRRPLSDKAATFHGKIGDRPRFEPEGGVSRQKKGQFGGTIPYYIFKTLLLIEAVMGSRSPTFLKSILSGEFPTISESRPLIVIISSAISTIAKSESR